MAPVLNYSSELALSNRIGVGRDETPDPQAIRPEGFSGQAQVACAWCGFYTPAGPSCELCGSPLIITHVALASDTASTEIVPDGTDTVEDPPQEVTEEEIAVPAPEAALEEPEAALEEPEGALEEPVAQPKPDRWEVESFVQRFQRWKQLRDRMSAGLPQEPPADPVPAEEAVVEQPVVMGPTPAPEPVAPVEPDAASPTPEPVPLAGPWGAPPPWSAALLPPRWHRPEPPAETGPSEAPPDPVPAPPEAPPEPVPAPPEPAPVFTPEPPPVDTPSSATRAEDPTWDPFTPPTGVDLPPPVEIDNWQAEPAPAEGSRRPSGWKRLWKRREQESVPQAPPRAESPVPVAAQPVQPAAEERTDWSETPTSNEVVERRDGVPCSRCGEPSERGLCEVCREALNELQGLIWGETES